MIRLPLFTYLRVEHYGLFPGSPAGTGLEWVFDKGLSLIAGVNGLGKTTVLTMMLRSLTGPYDITGEGVPDLLGSTLPAEPISLKANILRFFSQRVADQANKATVMLRATFGKDEVEIVRHLSDLRLIRFSINGIEQSGSSTRADREKQFQERICQLVELGSFVDVLLVLHHVLFFTERRPGAIWDENAQRQVLRALFLEKDLAVQVSTLERQVGAADSHARNYSAAAFRMQERLKDAQSREEHAPGVAADLSVEQRLLDAEVEERDRLNARLADLDAERKDARREHEQAKIQRERAENSVEELKFAVLSRLFPRMEDTARLVVLKILAGGDCLVCGADARQRRDELEQLLSQGYCPACGAEPARQENVVPPFKVEDARVKRARGQAELSRAEEAAASGRLDAAVAQYDAALNRLTLLQTSILDRTNRARRLSAQLPLESEEIRRLRGSLDETRRAQKEKQAERATFSRKLTKLLEGGRSTIDRKRTQLAAAFSEYVAQLISEQAELVAITTKARITQGAEDFEVPAFRPQMTAAARPGLARRNTPDDVSQSQRELVDLAFRLALIRLATGRAASSFVMETPEASLDELAMQRVGKALHDFANQGENRLVVTSNLTNAAMVTSIFGGKAVGARELRLRRSRVLNLIDVAAPNQAVMNDRKRYEGILTSALKGKG